MKNIINIAVVGLGQVGNYLQGADFKKMSFSEFNQFLIEYSKNSNYPDINQ